MQEVLLVIYLMVVLALIGVVLIQRSEGGGLGVGGGSGFMSARGTANALTRTTAILATLFFVLALAMSIYARYQPNATDVLDRIPGTTNNGNGVLDSLGDGQTTPSAPAAPAPVVPSNGVPTGGDAPASTAPASTTPAAPAPAATAPATPAPTTTAPAATTPSAPSSTTAPAAPAAPAPAAPAATPATPPAATGTGAPTAQ
ncbi:preprotein translocase subunit SecG [Rhizobium sp. NFR03]|uniref:preprotein translocase subunit SecG n=1 Tax=Rhizobium sp. NFR03 TaxID=1566263 RepID=UPI0008D5EF9E|nr:preprotein translocase subunit SecG [Rhizobium sp. NFR03]SES08263.1 preprotein translocase subunit SecG [Rhizobium sp. NFR03]